MGTTVTVRGLVAAQLTTDRDADNFSDNSFEIAESYLPSYELADFPDNGIVTLVALTKDETIATRAKTSRSEIPIQVAYQKKVEDVTNVSALDRLVNLVEELREAVRLSCEENPNYAWLRTEALRDENGTPHTFTSLREGSFFEAYFTAYFQVFE